MSYRHRSTALSKEERSSETSTLLAVCCSPLLLFFTSVKVRAVHTAKGRNLLVLARRYYCFSPKCSKVQQAVKKKMKAHPSDKNVYVGDGPDKRLTTDEELDCMREGKIQDMPAAAINVFLGGGWSFQIDDER